MILAPPSESGRFKHWQEHKLDPAGRPVEITDYRGMHLSMRYDNAGEIAGMINHRAGKRYGFNVARDGSGRIQKVESSWGDQRYAYDKSGLLANVDVKRHGASASAEWESGQLRKVKQFDGGEFSLTYDEAKGHPGRLKQVTTPDRLALTYRYDVTDRLSEIAVGNVSRLAIDYDPKGRLTGWRYRVAEGNNH